MNLSGFWDVGTVFFAVGNDLHHASGMGQELVIFWASFTGAGFESSGPMRDKIAGDVLQQAID